MQKSEQIGALVQALVKAQLELRNPALDKLHPAFKGFRYASLGSHIDAVRETFARHGLVISQHLETTKTGVSVTTLLAHISGEWTSSSVGMALAANATAQNLGSVVTYLRRYTIGSIAMLTGEDDTDAEEDRIAKSADTKATNNYPAKPRVVDVLSPVALTKVPAVRASEALKLRWPESGRDVVVPTKVVKRNDTTDAVLCTHITHGQQWVAFPTVMTNAVKIDKKIELTWVWNKGGFIEAAEVCPAPKMSDMKEFTL